MEYRRLLSNRNYVLLQSANFINRLGDSIDAIALSWLVYQISNSASVAAVNYALNYVPTVLLQPIVGAYVARKDKKKVMVIADVARGIIVAFLALMVLSGKANSTIVIICTFLMSCFETLRVPSGNAIIPLIIAKEDYKIEASFSSSLSRTVELIGTGIAGVIVAVLGIYAAIFLDAASFFLSAVCLCFMKIKEHIFTAEKADCLMNDFKAGLSYVLKKQSFVLLLPDRIGVQYAFSSDECFAIGFYYDLLSWRCVIFVTDGHCPIVGQSFRGIGLSCYQ